MGRYIPKHRWRISMADRSVSDAVDRQISTTLLGALGRGSHILFGHRVRCRLFAPTPQ